MIWPLVFALVLALSATGAWADWWNNCIQNKDIDRKVRGCTQIIERGKGESVRRKASAYNIRGMAYQKKGEFDHAIADHTKAITMTPNYADGYNARAWAYLKWGKSAPALPDAERAVELAPDNASFLDTRGQIYAALGRREEAIADLQKALSIDPDKKGSRDALERLGVMP